MSMYLRKIRLIIYSCQLPINRYEKHVGCTATRAFYVQVTGNVALDDTPNQNLCHYMSTILMSVARVNI